MPSISVLKTLETVDVVVLVAQRAALHPGKWDIPTFVSTHWRLYQHDAAGGSLVLASGTFALEPQRIYLIPPRLSFGTHCWSSCNQFYVHFELAGFPAIAVHDLFPYPLQIAESATFETAVRELSNHKFGDGALADPLALARNYRVKSVVYEALGRAVESLPEERLDVYAHRLSALQPVLPALEEIRNRIGDKLTNDELARRCYMSRDYFIRRFHAALGLSPAQYIVERRVALAAQRLLFTTDSLEEIASCTGFRNRFYLTRVFTRSMGVAPATYRRTPQA